jgi:glyoxylate reductase
MGKVVIVSPLPGRLSELLRGHTLVQESAERMSSERLHAALADAEALLSLLWLPVDEPLLRRAPRLRVIANYAVGFDNIDVAAASRRGIVVTHTPGILTAATADLAMALLLAAARRVREGLDLARSGAWQGWAPDQLIGRDLEGALLGLVGFGRIGQAMAQRARVFGLRIAYSAPRRADPDLEHSLGATWRPLPELLAESDFISLHCPLTKATFQLLGDEEFRNMKPTAVLINTARGAVVDEAALIRALEDGRLFGAGLDVYEAEPAIPEALRRHERVVLLPHLGSATVGTRTRMAEMAARSIADVLGGRRPAHVVNPEVFVTLDLAPAERALLVEPAANRD